MSFIEQEFKDRFKNQQSLEGIDSDQLWAGISSNIEGQANSTSSKRKRIGALILLLLLFTCSICYFFYSNQNIPDQKQADQKASNVFANEPKLAPQNDPVVNTSISKKDKEESIVNSAAVTNDQKIQSSTKTNEPPSFSKSTNNNKTTEATKHSFSIPNKANNKPEVNTSQLDFKAATLSNLEDEKESPHENLFVLNELEFIPTLNIYLPNESYVELELNLLGEEQKIDKKLNQQVELSVLTGVNTAFSFFSANNSNATLKEQLDNAYSNKPGHSTSLKLSWIINNKYRISSGIEYSNIWTKFSAVQEKEEIGLVEDYLVYFEYNPQTGDTINAIYDDLMLNGINRRNVVHHNNFKYFSIPLEIGLQGRKGQLTYGLNAGLSANFFIQQKGKSLSENLEITEFDDSANQETPFEQFFLSYHLNPFLDFEVSEKIKLRLSPVVSYQTFGTSNLYQLKQSSIYTSINTGVVVLLKD